jgi:hypothetical protein
MKITIADLKTERHWRSSTGYTKEQFFKLLTHFEKTYLAIFGKTLPERQAEGPKESLIKSTEELLFFTLFSLKSGLTYDLLGLVIGLDGSNAKRNQDTGISVLKSMLCEQGYAPARSFDTVDEFNTYFHKYDTLIIDATEQPIQRPADQVQQKKLFWKEKKTYYQKHDNYEYQ